MITIHSNNPLLSTVMLHRDEFLTEKEIAGCQDRWVQIDTDLFFDDEEEFTRIMLLCAKNFVSISFWSTEFPSNEYRAVSLYFHMSKYNLVCSEILPKQ